MSKPIERLKNEIRALYDGSLKKPHNVAKEYPKLYAGARRVFGSWQKALKACGIDHDRARILKKWSRAKVTEEINKLCLNGDSLRLKDLRRKGMICLISAATYHFGSWHKAVESSGMCYSFRRGKRGFRKSKLLPMRSLRDDGKS